MLRPRLIVLQPTPYCNINCSYCYLRRRDDRRLMPDAVLDAVRTRIFDRLDPDRDITVSWHAGEPTAAPIDWYRKAYEALQTPARPNVRFTMQSNGVALDERWIEFFQSTDTNVGISIDGPQRFHDECRRTRSGRPTWEFALRGLTLLQRAGLDPHVITVLHPDGLDAPREYYDFYRQHGIANVSFSIDEREGANGSSRFSAAKHKDAMVRFTVALLELAYRDQYPLRIREVERVAQMLAGVRSDENELIEPWGTIIVAADGSVSTFSPELMEVNAPQHGNFVFGNILESGIDELEANAALRQTHRRIVEGIDACRDSCRYFGVCGGGNPVNKFCERNDFAAAETDFCRLTIQAAADSLTSFLSRRQTQGKSEAAPVATARRAS